MRVGQAVADLALAVWLVSFLAWSLGRRAGRAAGRQLVAGVELLVAHGSAVAVVVAPAVLLAWAVYR